MFTSIHEVMVHSVRMAYPEDLQEVLRDTLREATPEEDFLTDKGISVLPGNRGFYGV